VVVVQDLTEMVGLGVVVAIAVVERFGDDDDKVDSEKMDDDGYYYCQLLKVDLLVWVKYLLDKAIRKKK